MAERRMIAKSVICKDDFYDLPAETKVLYLYVNMEADDDGFCDSVRAVMRTCGADRENLRQLIDSGFLLEFKGDVVAVRHWKTNNCIRADRYHPTRHAKERASLSVEKTGEYEPKAQRDAAEEREDAADEQLVANLATEDRQGIPNQTKPIQTKPIQTIPMILARSRKPLPLARRQSPSMTAQIIMCLRRTSPPGSRPIPRWM